MKNMNNKMVSGFERVFRPLKLQGYVGNDIYQEVYMHYIHFLNEDGTVRKSKLDRMENGKIWIESRGQHSLYGECDYVFPDGTQKRLLALGTDVRGNPIIPGIV